jgi:hypothetical protein
MKLDIDRKVIYTALVCLAVGWWLGSSPSSPVGPAPTPERPVLHAFARLTRAAARLGLWIALASERPPQKQEDDPKIARAANPEGQLDNSRW